MTKSDLKTGWIVTARSGIEYIVLLDTDIVCYGDGKENIKEIIGKMEDIE